MLSRLRGRQCEAVQRLARRDVAVQPEELRIGDLEVPHDLRGAFEAGAVRQVLVPVIGVVDRVAAAADHRQRQRQAPRE
jgi:hypothetical protein